MELQNKGLFLEAEGVKNELDRLKKDYMVKNRAHQIAEDKLGAASSQIKELLNEQKDLSERLRKVG